VSKLNSCSPAQVERSQQTNERQGNAPHPYVPPEAQLDSLYVDLPPDNINSNDIDPRRLSVGTRTALALVRSTEEDEKEIVKVKIFGEETFIRPRLLSENTQLVLALAASQEDCYSPRQNTEPEQLKSSAISPVNPEWEVADEKFTSDVDRNPPSGQILTASAPPNDMIDSVEVDEKSESCIVLKSPSETVPTTSTHPQNKSQELKREEEETEESVVVCSIEERNTRQQSASSSVSKPKELEFEMKVLKVNVQRKQEIEMNVFTGKNCRKRSSISWTYSVSE